MEKTYSSNSSRLGDRYRTRVRQAKLRQV